MIRRSPRLVGKGGTAPDAHSELRSPTRASELDHRRLSGSASTCARSLSKAARQSGRSRSRWWLTADIRAVLSGHGLEVWRGRVGPGQELVEPALRVAVDDPGEHVGQIGLRLDAHQLAGLDQG